MGPFTFGFLHFSTLSGAQLTSFWDLGKSEACSVLLLCLREGNCHVVLICFLVQQHLLHLNTTFSLVFSSYSIKASEIVCLLLNLKVALDYRAESLVYFY